jgi:DNA (cytosine-5)-methyltransferase 1
VNYLSVCSGIEAATVAWHHMGWKPVGFSEIEKFPSQVLTHHYPQVTNFGDMTKYKEWKLDDSIGLLVGGTPCQSFSVAGLRKGLDDPRGNLALTYVGILDKFRPKWCIWENVPGVLSSGGGRDFGAFLGALGELGYGWAYRVLDAQNFGVAQRRRRVFVVGCLGGWESAAKVLFESESLSGNIAKGRSSWKETTTDAGISTQLCGPLTARDYKGISSDDCNERYMKMVATPKIANCLETTCNDYSRADGFTMIAYENHPSDSRVKEMGDICQTVTSTWGSGGGNIPFVQKAYSVREDATVGNFHAKELDVNPCLGALWPGVQSHHTQTFIAEDNVFGFNTNARPDEMNFLENQSNTLTTGQRAGVGCIGGQHPNAAIGENISPTLTNAMGAGGGHIPIIGNMAVRRLTEVECERLQGFPDNYTNIKENCPSGVRYKALGNSMAVPVMRWIGERINEYEQRGMA